MKDILSIIMPSLVAIISLLVTYSISKKSQKSEMVKLFYHDRLDAYKNIVKEFNSILRSMEFVLSVKKYMSKGNSFAEIYINTIGILPVEIHKKLQDAIFQATIYGRTRFYNELDLNQIFYTDNVVIVIKESEVKYFQVISEPLEPQNIDVFIEDKKELIETIRKKLIFECQKAVGMKV